MNNSKKLICLLFGKAPTQTSPIPFNANSTTDLMASGSSMINVTVLPSGNETTTQQFTNATFSSSTMTTSLAAQMPTMCIPRQLYCDGMH